MENLMYSFYHWYTLDWNSLKKYIVTEVSSLS